MRIQDSQGTGKTGNLVTNFSIQGKPREFEQHREKWIIFTFRFKFEVGNFIVVTRVIEHIFSCKNTQGKICKLGENTRNFILACPSGMVPQKTIVPIVKTHCRYKPRKCEWILGAQSH